MKNKSIIAVLPLLLALALTGCGDKNAPDTPSISSTSSSTVEETPAPVAPGPLQTPTLATTNGLDNTEAQELGKTVESYNKQVDASNDKAKDIIDGYTKQIESATGK